MPTIIQLNPLSKIGIINNPDNKNINDSKRKNVETFGSVLAKKLKAITYLNINSFQFNYNFGILAIENLNEALHDIKNGQYYQDQILMP